MSDNEKPLKDDVTPPKAETENAGESSTNFGGFGTASSWLNQGSSWGASFLNSAREKTMTTFDLVKKDLNDLSDAVTAEVTDLATVAKEGFGTAANAVKQQAQILEKLVTPSEEEKPLPGDDEKTEGQSQQKEQSSSLNFGWMTKIVDTVADTVKNLGMEETTTEEDEFTEKIQPKQTRKTGLPQDVLTKIQTSEETFLDQPEVSEFYKRWILKFRLDEYDGEINMILANNPVLRKMFAKLVPAEVDNETFWLRYFYRIEYAEIEEEMNKSTLSEALEIDVGRRGKKGSADSSKKSSPSSESSAVVVEEPTSPSQSDWSVCSEKNVEEILSNDEEETQKGPLTPKPKDDKKEEGWVDWDE